MLCNTQNAGSVPPAAAAPADEDGPRERLVALLQDLLKQQMVRTTPPGLQIIEFPA